MKRTGVKQQMSEEKKVNAAPEEEAELTAEQVNGLRQVRIDKLNDLKAQGRDPFEITKYDVTASCAKARADYEALEARLKDEAGDDEEKLAQLLEENKVEVSIAGRVMSRRLMGKAGFLDLRDKSGKIQSYVKRDDVGVEAFQDYKKGDIGDIIGIKGFVFRTRMVKTGRVKRMEPDFDLRPRFQYIDTNKYDVSSCPQCGYTAMNRYFTHLSTGQVKMIEEGVCHKFKGQKQPKEDRTR